MTLLILYFFVAVFVSFYCSILESAFLTQSPAYIESLKEDKPRLHKVLSAQKKDLTTSISAILILNTISHTIGAAGVGAQAERIFGTSYMFFVSALLTLGILIFSEIIPKTLGSIYHKELSTFTAYSIRAMVFITYPLLILTRSIGRLLPKTKKQTVSKKEIISTALMSEFDGVLDETESDVIENTLSLKEIKISEILTPRSVIYSLGSNMILSEAIREKNIFRYSRIPIYGESRDDVVGMVMAKTIFSENRDFPDKTLMEISKKITILHENISVSKALDMFIKKKEHLFLVRDSYDQVEGIITLEDCIETILGLEIVDEFDEFDDMQQHAKDIMKTNRKASS